MRKRFSHLLTAGVILTSGAQLLAASFTTSNTTNAGSYGTVTGQSFSPSTSPSPDPALATGATVYLSQFQFFKGAALSADSAPNLELVILNAAYPNLTGLTATSSAVVGISTNTLATTATYNSGDALTFNFNNLALTYGTTYAAGLFSQNTVTGALTPTTTSLLTANYAASGSDYVPTTNYGGLDNYNAAAYGGVSGGYYSAYSHGGDTNFYATLATTVPEPASMAAVAMLTSVVLRRRR